MGLCPFPKTSYSVLVISPAVDLRQIIQLLPCSVASQTGHEVSLHAADHLIQCLLRLLSAQAQANV
jgi:hypothetical protein